MIEIPFLRNPPKGCFNFLGQTYAVTRKAAQNAVPHYKEQQRREIAAILVEARKLIESGKNIYICHAIYDLRLPRRVQLSKLQAMALVQEKINGCSTADMYFYDLRGHLPTATEAKAFRINLLTVLIHEVNNANHSANHH